MAVEQPKKCFMIGMEFGIVVCLFVLLYGSYGCVKPPVREIADAEVALAAARSSGAERYLRGEYEDIEEKLGKARLMAEKREYKAARSLALESAGEAWQVKSQAEKVKEKAREDAEKALAIAHKGICDLEEKRTIEYDIEEYKAILKLFREVQKEYDEERYHHVIEKAESIIQRCEALKKKALEVGAQQKSEGLQCEKRKQIKKAKGLSKQKRERWKSKSMWFNLVNVFGKFVKSLRYTTIL